MKWSYKILRSLAVSLIVLIFVVPAAIYVALSLPGVQNKIRQRAEKELSEVLTVPVSIGKVMINPFNRVTLERVAVGDARGDTALFVRRLGAGMSLWDYFYRDRIVLDYAEIIGLDARINRDSLGAPLNIQPIIEALAPKDKNKPPTRFDLQINTVVIRQSAVAYDVFSLPAKSEGFDPNHIAVSDLRADINLPQIKNDDFIIDLRRMAFSERSGLTVTSLSGNFHISQQELAMNNFELRLPDSHLRINDQTIAISGLKDLPAQLRQKQFNIQLKPGSHLSTTDLTCFLPQLKDLNIDFQTDIHLEGGLEELNIRRFELQSSTGAIISAEGLVSHLDNKELMAIDLPSFAVKLNSPRALLAALRFTDVSPQARNIINNLGDIELNGSASADMTSGKLTASLSSAPGAADLDASFSRSRASADVPMKLSGTLTVSDFSGATLMGESANQLARLTDLDATADFSMTLLKDVRSADVDLDISSLTFNGQTISDLSADLHKQGNEYSGRLFVDDSRIFADADISALITRTHKTLDLNAEIHDVSLSLLGVAHGASNDGHLSASLTASLSGTDIDDVAGRISIASFEMQRAGHTTFNPGPVEITSVRSEAADTIRINSEIADATMTGRYRLASLPAVGKAILAQTLPALAGEKAIADERFWTSEKHDSELTYDIRLKTLQPLEALAKMPVSVINPIDISGDFSTRRRSMSVRVDAPYIVQGNKLIENTALLAGVNGSDSLRAAPSGHVYLTTTLPTKNGPMTLIATSSARGDCIDSHLEWRIDRDRDFSGDLSLTAAFERTEDKALRTNVNINPSRAVFNDTVWTIDPAQIAVEGKEITVSDFKVWHDRQFISIDGRASELPTDTLGVTLEDVSLDYVFETLDIPTAMFGGNVTGKLFATRLLTKAPEAYTPGLSVKRLTYNNSLLGDAVIASDWNNTTGAISLNARISQPGGEQSTINGAIYPLADSLDLDFNCNRIQIGFLKPYMAAFATDVSGYASGHARLYGTFKLIDMTGDVYGEDVSLTIGFTNVTYTTTDSVHLRPGNIAINDLTLRDRYGNTAKLNGWVRHECFKNPSFDFRISDARELLVYDMKENSEFRWYGRVFGNGGARIDGAPGYVNIGVDMTTAANSSFTYTLSDALSAQDYNFIAFRDRDQARKDSIAALNAPPDPVREFLERVAHNDQSSAPSKYAMKFNIGITPQATITLVMDPVSGDRVRCHGNGVLGMTYDSANEDLRMTGTYTLDDGKYNFTLQDIIIKDFTIEPGSSIAFNGDPYSAQLNLTAKFQVKANLTDLDESFSDDKELNRTNVPVDALLKVTGDMRQPDISFDLAFPTLTEETRRKVRSIINTEEMMNRQIIYLLALNRFYTPDYMNATRGNELVSVASSTISSQLSNILGQLSDNFSLAPNFRSDRGDFSDMEFDMAISSNLLNNRLLLNGNLGYRDKSLNNNSFIGDFDIEYLLNRNGSLRLKAYNRYNDQNYYLKSALTTQGIGLVFKRDFDNILSFLNPFRRHRRSATPLPTDSLPADSLEALPTAK